MHEDPFVIGTSSIMNISSATLSEIDFEIGSDIVVAPVVGGGIRAAFRDAASFVDRQGTVVAIRMRRRGADAYVQRVARDGDPLPEPHILAKTRKCVRSEDGTGVPSLDSLRELFASTPAGARVVGLTSCGGMLMVLAVERRFHLVCIEPDASEFRRSVANVGRALGYSPLNDAVNGRPGDDRCDLK